MNCTNCGAPLRDGTAFCTNCGSKVTPVSGTPCSVCGAIVPDGMAFCTNCGTPMNAAPAAPSGVPCRTCGAIVPDGMAFCTSCGTPVNAAPEPPAAPVQQQQSFSQNAGFAAVPYPGKSASTTCRICGRTIPEGYAFCTGCGSPVGAAPAEPEPEEPAYEPPVVCWSCDALVPAGVRFCTKCGADLNDMPTPIPESYPEEKKSRKGLWIGLICVLLALIAGLAVAYFTGALDGVLGNDREDTEESDDRDDDEDDDDKQPADDQEEEEAADDQQEEEAAEPSEEPEEEPDYLLPDSATRYLTEADLEELSWRELCLARNEIFARHGRIFNTPEIREYFEGKDWYEGRYSEVTLTDLETANVNFIAQYEKEHFGGSYY